MNKCPNCNIDLAEVSETTKECPKCQYSYAKGPKKQSIIDKATQEFIDTIVEARLSDEGLAPWESQFVVIPKRNYDTGNQYKGVNRWLLSYSAEISYITKHSAEKRGAVIKPDAKESTVIIWRPPSLKKHEKSLPKDKQQEILSKRPFFRGYHYIYRVKDVEGLEPKQYPEDLNNKRYSSIEQFIQSSKLSIDEGGNTAAYVRDEDKIIIPRIEQYNSSQEYYRDLFRQVAHWTRHSTRLDRKECSTDKEMAREQLVAEMVSGYLCVYFNIPINKNHVSYFDYWLQKIKDDSILVSTAGQRAEKVLTYLNIS